jgi:polyketide cyclase/dehydrase/lipid transport protein
VAGFDVVRQTSLSAPEAWQRVTDWRRHQEFAPLTTIRLTCDPESGREVFVARTGIGPLGFDDVMEVTYAVAPTQTSAGLARIVKTGRVVVGWAVLTVTPTADGATVRWHEEARLRGTGGPVAAVVNHVVRSGFGRLLDGLLAV